MQNELISKTQLIGVFDSLKCVMNAGTLSGTPWLVIDDPVTVHAC
jgi:hypothetical protein